jgi:hypothetical protein
MKETEEMQKRLSEALGRIGELEKDIEAMRRRTNVMINGHSRILARLINHTKCNPAIGTTFDLILDADVGRQPGDNV